MRDNADYFFITDNKLKKKYEISKLEKIINLVKTGKYELVYDGNCPYHTEVVSRKFLDNYMENFDLEVYPYKIFYLVRPHKEKVKQID